MERRSVSYLVEPNPELAPDWEGPAICPRCHRQGIMLTIPTMVLFRHRAEQARLNASWRWITVSAAECLIFPGVEGMIAPTAAALDALDEATGYLHREAHFEPDLDRLIDHEAIRHKGPTTPEKDGPAPN